MLSNGGVSFPLPLQLGLGFTIPFWYQHLPSHAVTCISRQHNHQWIPWYPLKDMLHHCLRYHWHPLNRGGQGLFGQTFRDAHSLLWWSHGHAYRRFPDYTIMAIGCCSLLYFIVYIQNKIYSFNSGVTIFINQHPWFRHPWPLLHPPIPPSAHTMHFLSMTPSNSLRVFPSDHPIKLLSNPPMKYPYDHPIKVHLNSPSGVHLKNLATLHTSNWAKNRLLPLQNPIKISDQTSIENPDQKYLHAAHPLNPLQYTQTTPI